MISCEAGFSRTVRLLADAGRMGPKIHLNRTEGWIAVYAGFLSP